MHRGFRYRLHPTAAQAHTLREWSGASRFVYNLAFEQRRDFWRQFRRQTGKWISLASQSHELTTLREEVDWLAAAPRVVLEAAIRSLDKAFANFFAGRGSYPSPRRKGVNDSIRFQVSSANVRKLNGKWSAVNVPKIGWVKYRDTRPLGGWCKSFTIAEHAAGWAISMCCDVVAGEAQPRDGAVGIDRGIANTLTLSTGEQMNAPSASALLARRKRGQRALARCKRGSKRYAAQRRHLARLSARTARIRQDWAHRVSTDLAKRFGLVALENLNIRNMTASARGTAAEHGNRVRQKAGLNRSILEQCWGRFAAYLEYKMTERGGVLISVPAAYTSQTCASCGVVDARSRKSQAVFNCVHCDHADNADVNAAKEILRRSTAWTGVEGSHRRPVEAPIQAIA